MYIGLYFYEIDRYCIYNKVRFLTDFPEIDDLPAVFGRHGRKIKAPKWKQDYYSPVASSKRAHNSGQEGGASPSKCENIYHRVSCTLYNSYAQKWGMKCIIFDFVSY